MKNTKKDIVYATIAPYFKPERREEKKNLCFVRVKPRPETGIISTFLSQALKKGVVVSKFAEVCHRLKFSTSSPRFGVDLQANQPGLSK